jgi:SAM-dependent methyltransferase
VISPKSSKPADLRISHFRRYFLYEWLADAGAHRGYLRRAYAEALNRARQCQPGLFSGRAPRILLCGVGAAGTADTFCRFALGEFPDAQITLFDLRPEVLKKSLTRLRACGVGRTDQITAQPGNALHMPFAPASFDWIETDNFLQFIAPDDLAQLIANWQTVLKPGVLLTTRQFFAGDPSRGRLVRAVWKLLCRMISAPSHEHSADEIQAVLRAHEFSVVEVWKAPNTFGLITALAAFKK